MFFKIGVPKNFAMFTEKHLCWSIFLKKLQTCNFTKKRLQYRCLHVDITNILRPAFLWNISGGCSWKSKLFYWAPSIRSL